MKIQYIILITPLLILSCKNNDSKGLPIPEEQFVNLYAEMLVLREENSLSQTDSSRMKRSLDSLYANYQTTPSEFDSSLQYYRKDLARWKKLYEDVSNRLETIQQQVRQKPTK